MNPYRYAVRKYFFTYVARHDDEKGMTKDEIRSTLVIAGSHTVSNFVSGIMHEFVQMNLFLIRNSRMRYEVPLKTTRRLSTAI